MRLTQFNGFVVTANDDHSIPINSQVIGEPISVDHVHRRGIPHRFVAVDIDWLVKTFNKLVTQFDELEEAHTKLQERERQHTNSEEEEPAK